MFFRSVFTKRLNVIIVIVLLGASYVWAGPPQPVGKIAGQVVDEDGEAIIGANVFIDSTRQGASADFDGNFVILNISPGVYDIEITAVGYWSRVFKNIEVKPGETTKLTAFLKVLDFRYSGFAGTPDLILAPPRLGAGFKDFVDRLVTRGSCILPSLSEPTSGVPDYSMSLNVSSPEYQRSTIMLWNERSRYRAEAEVSNSLALGETTRFPSRTFLRKQRAKGEWVCVEPPRRYSSRFRNFAESIIANRKGFRWIYDDGYHLYSNRVGSKLTFAINPVYGYEVWNTDDEREQISRFTGGIRMEGGYRGKIRFMMDFRDHTEAGNQPYDSREKLYEDRWGTMDLSGGSSTSYNISESFIQYYGKDLSLTAGRGRFQWGPGQFGSLFLGSKQPPFDYVRFSAVFDEDIPGDEAVFYTFIHGFLQSSLPSDTLYYSPGGRARFLNREKYLSAQRLEIRPRGNLLLAMNQAVVYGDRGPQLGYLTPLNFLYSVQHSGDDKDNFVLGFDGTFRPFAGLKVYGETFFDDIIVGELLKSSATNKSAYTVGLQGIIPRTFWQNFDLKGEYTKIRPFVYSHVFATNTYTNWNSPMGYTKEPNSEFTTAELRGSFYPYYVTAHFSRQNHGANTDSLNVGGDIYLPWSGEKTASKPLLAGKFEHTDRLGLKVQWEALENLWLFGEGMQVIESRKQNRFETHLGFAWNL